MPLNATVAPITNPLPVIVTAVPPLSDPEFGEIENTCGGGAGDTVSVALLVVPPYTPEMVADPVDETTLVVTVKVALGVPAVTVTLAGVVAMDELLESETTAPPDGAEPLKVTVPCDEFPPVTLVGFIVSDDSVILGGGEPVV